MSKEKSLSVEEVQRKRQISEKAIQKIIEKFVQDTKLDVEHLAFLRDVSNNTNANYYKIRMVVKI